MAGRYKAYPEYKDSGIDWLGEIPESWIALPIKRVSSFTTGMTPSTAVSEYYADDETDYEWIRPEDIKETSESVSASKFLTNLGWKTQRVVPAQSSLICCIGTIGKTGYSLKPVTTNQQITAATFNLSPKYYFYVLLAARAELEQMATGNVVQILNTERLGRLYVPFITENEALKIANFLDHETAKIDTLIAKQEKLIDLLKEKRQAVISHAVTKGLNPDAPMKDSGVEWLGEVPEHWICGRLKNTLRIRNGKDYKDVEVEDGGYPVYGSGGIFKRSSAYLFDGKSVLFGRKGTVDKPLLVEGKFWTVDTMFYSELNTCCRAEFVYFQSLLFPFNLLSTNTALPSMTQEDLLELGFVIPPLAEQDLIIEKIILKNSQFDDLILKAENQVQLLQERRTAVISAAVTGKIDVRDWKPPVHPEALDA